MEQGETWEKNRTEDLGSQPTRTVGPEWHPCHTHPLLASPAVPGTPAAPSAVPRVAAEAMTFSWVC